jgi:glycosyltransferase involved in cell wall biosynthesis
VAEIDEIDIPDLQDSPEILLPTLRVISQLRSVVRKQNPAIIHLHAIHELSLFSVKIARELNIPLIFHFHGSVTELDIKVLKPILPFLQNILVVSEATRLSLLPYLSSEARVDVLVNGVEDLGGRLAIKEQTLEQKLLIVGRIEHEKGFDVAIKALGIILKEMPFVRLMIIKLIK